MYVVCKKWLCLLAIVSVSISQYSCDNRQQQTDHSEETTSGNVPKITFAEKGVYNFGTITEGDTVEHSFTFVNNGSIPLIINNITASCGCTTPEWPREPIAPGAKSFIRVRFNSRGKQGEQHKTVSIFANTDPAITDLQFRVMVKPKYTVADSTQKPVS
ncbi:hypothetical protein GCM10023187_08590 [Nibrella viscosa]|uniref:DUF1573 domain-containing protein n=1 Tax=Nibrella viscosa TaxID=1084524 RepID=A0ABP8JZB2_9BACT